MPRDFNAACHLPRHIHTASQQRTPGIESRRFAENELLGRDVIAWGAAWETLPAQPIRRILAICSCPSPQCASQSGPPFSSAHAGDRLSPVKLFRFSDLLCCLDQPIGRVWTSLSRLRSKSERGTLRGDHRCCRTALGNCGPLWNEPDSAGQIGCESDRCSHFSTRRVFVVSLHPRPTASVLPTSGCSTHDSVSVSVLASCTVCSSSPPKTQCEKTRKNNQK